MDELGEPPRDGVLFMASRDLSLRQVKSTARARVVSWLDTLPPVHPAPESPQQRAHRVPSNATVSTSGSFTPNQQDLVLPNKPANPLAESVLESV